MTTSPLVADPDLDVHLDLLPLDPDQLTASRAAADTLSAAERQRLHRLRRPEDRAAYLVAHVELRRRLGARLGLPAGALRLVRRPCPRCARPTGRPRTDPDQGVEFSVSHTDGLVAIALASARVGVDVQRLPALVSPALLRALATDEAAGLRAGRPDALPARVARCWARKEAVLKGVGVGVGHGVGWPYVGAEETPPPVPGWRLTDLPTPDGYAGALAVRAPADGAAP